MISAHVEHVKVYVLGSLRFTLPCVCTFPCTSLHNMNNVNGLGSLDFPPVGLVRIEFSRLLSGNRADPLREGLQAQIPDDEGRLQHISPLR